MKKFYSFLFAAVALVGFAACNSDSTEEPAPAQQVGKMEFTANIGEDTKTQLTEGGKVKWDGNDAIAVWNGTDVKKYTVKELFNDDKSAIFQGDALTGDTFCAVYPYVEGATYTDSKWNVTIPTEQVAVAGSFADDAALAYGEYQGNYTFSFTNENAVLKFQVEADCQMVEFFNGENSVVKVKGAMAAGNDYYAVVAPETYTFTVRIDGYLSKQGTKALDLEKNKIYNLGVLPAPKAEAKTTINLVPNNSYWNQHGARFAAYVWYVGGYKWYEMTAVAEKEGVYTCEIPADADGIIFGRVNPAFEGPLRFNTEEENNTQATDRPIWNQTADLELPEGDKNYYHITNWAAGLWLNAADAEIPTFKVYVIAQPGTDAAKWEDVYIHAFIAGSDNFTEWPGEEITANTQVINGYTYNYYEFPTNASGANVSIVVNNNDGKQTNDIELGTLDTDYYVVYCKDNNLANLETNTAPFAEGTIKEYEAPAETEKVIYLKPGVWSTDNAYFEAWVWGSSKGDAWYKFTLTNEDGIYSTTLPIDATGMKILRKAPNSASESWNSWNDSGDQTIPADKNMFIVNNWDNYSWGTK